MKIAPPYLSGTRIINEILTQLYAQKSSHFGTHSPHGNAPVCRTYDP